MTDDEKLRAEISAQVFDEQPAATAPVIVQQPESKSDDAPKAEPEAVAEVPVDEWAGVSPALRKTVEALQAKVGEVEQLQFRVKQAESRLGAATNELSELKKKPEPVKEEPAPEPESSKKFREDYPEIATPFEERIAALRAEVLQKVPTIDEKSLAETISKTLKAEISRDFAVERLDELHPGWQQRKESEEFKAWHKTAKGVPEVATTFVEAKKLLDAYAEFKKGQKSPAEIEASRQKRLEQAQSTEGRKLPAVKAESDMTPAELRAHIAAQVFK